ncbi:MAG: hypothetical protein M1549_01940 [Candidatus Dependentiae bacterium]|nr:hypothetical protein [Candidatus Dependentiae bacterium]
MKLDHRPPYRNAQFVCLLFIGIAVRADRSVYHPRNDVPRLKVFWSEKSPLTGLPQKVPDEDIYLLSNSFLEEWAIFDRFDRAFHLRNQPPEVITYRNEPDKSVTKQELDSVMDHFVAELRKKKKSPDSFTDCIILKDNDFNYRRGCGIIIVKLKKYPLVLKLLMEKPDTFVNPYSKGFVPTFLFSLGGGINRFIAGFTRIPNLHAINAKIAADPRWSQLVSAPRKWFWLPKDVLWFTVEGKNFGTAKKLSIDFPSTYGILCDEIIAERTLQISNREDRALALDLAHFIGNRIDPHICNFMIEKGTGKIVFIDTEHFASIVGLREPLTFTSYADWYVKLSNNCFKKSLFRSKETRRRNASGTPEHLVLLPPEIE